MYTPIIAYFINGDQIVYERLLEGFYFTKTPLRGTRFDWTIFIMGSLYQMVGIQQLLLQYLHIMLLMISMLYVYDIMIDLQLKSIYINLAMTWIAFEPMLIFSSSVTNREAPIIFLITQSIYYFYFWFSNKGNKWLVLAIINVFIAALMHNGVLALAFGYVFIYMIYNPSKRYFSINLMKGFVFIGVVAMFTFFI